MAPAAQALSDAMTSSSRLLASLAQVTRDHPHARKRLLGVDVNHGRELLLALARDGGGWVGWEATTLRSLADDLAFVPLHARGLHIATDVELTALISTALERAIAGGAVREEFSVMTRHRGFRTALQDSLLELRIAGITPHDLAAAALPGSPAAQLVPVLEAYERVLVDAGVVDPAGVFQVALECFDDEVPFVLDGVTALVPTLSTRGVTGAFVRRLISHGAVLLEVDRAWMHGDGTPEPDSAMSLLSQQDDVFPRSVLGWSLATQIPERSDPAFDASLAAVDLFGASTPSEELREVCRRVLAEGLPWDAVEIVTTDPDVYGIALDALCQQLGIGATMLKGIPLIRTRIGRALVRWFSWLANGLPADVLRQALEAGEISVAGTDVPAHDIARELRAAKVGWGRARYAALITHLAAQHAAPPADHDDDVSKDERVARSTERKERDRALESVVRWILSVTPEVPERGAHDTVLTTTATLASHTLSYIRELTLHTVAERQTMERLTRRLGRLAELEEAPVAFESALAGLQDALSDLRAWPPTGEARKPYRADGGLLHLTDMEHAGSSGRVRTFVVGMDAERTSGSPKQDPLLPDVLRRAIGRTRLPDVNERRHLALERIGVALASLRGRVTMSWSTRGGNDGRDGAPSPLVLQVFRVLSDDPRRDYAQLRLATMPPVCAVPRAATATSRPLDRRDIWLEAIASAPVFLEAQAIVQRAFPLLAHGLAARAVADAPTLSAHRGLMAFAGPLLDPTRSTAPAMSPSGLETLGKCPLQWFYKYGLGIRTPEDPEFDGESWLDAMQRGSLLHEVFESFVRQFLGNQEALLDFEASSAAMQQITTAVIAKWRELEPPPSESVFDAEIVELHAASRAFLRMERDALSRGDELRWSDVEYGFGEDTPASYRLTDDRTIRLRGRVDRIDVGTDGALRIVDYKTGAPSHYRPNPKVGPFNGGRLIQPAAYAEAVGTALQRAVTRFEYRFPTERGGNAIVGFDASDILNARGVVTALVDHVSSGRFLPTTDAHDCQYCDYAAICRVRIGEHAADSPRAAWAKANAASLEEYSSMLRRRGAVIEDDQ
ncbi:MAG: PD-(D/E)XK nuclease family protein [Gemmatimonadaceae bacterium]|nr:PD-(D/E)XK nuclease family protein [Gemmatimonadaceae bacterium]